MWNQVSYDPRSYERNLCNCACRSLKNSGLQRGLNPWPRDTVEFTKYSLYLRSFYGRLKSFLIQCELKLFASRCYQTNSTNKLKLSLSQSPSHNLVLGALTRYSFFVFSNFKEISSFETNIKNSLISWTVAVLFPTFFFVFSDGQTMMQSLRPSLANVTRSTPATQSSSYDALETFWNENELEKWLALDFCVGHLAKSVPRGERWRRNICINLKIVLNSNAFRGFEPIKPRAIWRRSGVDFQLKWRTRMDRTSSMGKFFFFNLPQNRDISQFKTLWLYHIYNMLRE